MSGTINSVVTMFFKNKSTVGFLSLDALVNENIKLPSDVTKYPVEDGGEEISDHITRNNEELSITGSVSSSDILSFEFGSCTTKLIKAVDQLRSMHKERKPITVVTGLGKYEDMAFTSLSVTRSNGANGGGWLDINADLRKIKKVSLKQAELPSERSKNGKTGKTDKSSGTSSKEQFGPPDLESKAHVLKNGASQMFPETTKSLGDFVTKFLGGKP